MSALVFLTLMTWAAPTLQDLDSTPDVARTRFLAKARAAGFEIASDRVGEDFIDSAYREGSGRNAVVLISGIHGVEQPAGDFIQRYVLANCRPRQASLFLLHGLNPHGARHGRRVNGHNVDLNRNCFAKFVARENPDYNRHRALLENELSAWQLVLHLPEEASVRRALSGQYSSPDGIYYGGREVEAECRIAQTRLTPVVERARDVLLLDLHTGLGDRGIAQIMLDGNVTGAESRVVNQTLFPKHECRGVCEVQTADAYDFATHGDITQWIYDAFPGKRERDLVVSATLEIGTEGALTVLPALVNENVCHRDGCPKQAEFAAQLRRLFTPTDYLWRGQLVRAAQQVCRAVERFDAR